MNKNINYSFIFLLPTCLYFVFNRFDIVPALVSLIVLYSVYKERYNLAAILLAIGVMTKAYLLVCLPICLVYYYSKHNKFNFNMITLFILTTFLILVPFLIMGGIDTLKVPFSFQLERSHNGESIYFFLSLFFPKIFEHYDLLISRIFIVLSLSTLLFVINSRIDSFKLLLKRSLLAILIFMVFLKFYSPQWIIWVVFLLILNIESRRDVLKIILFQIVTYLCFPIAFVIYGPSSIQFIILAVVRTVLLFSFIAPLLIELLPSSYLFASLVSLVQKSNVINYKKYIGGKR